jgi:hypothetical protein
VRTHLADDSLHRRARHLLRQCGSDADKLSLR